MKLYEIIEELNTVRNEIDLFLDQAETEPPAEELEKLFRERLDSLKCSFDTKMENIGRLFLVWQAEVEAVNNEIKRLNAKKAAIGNKIDSLKKYIELCLPGQGKWKSPIVSFSWRKSEAVEIFDQLALPKAYCKVQYVPSKTDIKLDLQSGAAVPGCRLVKKNNLQIK